jgi:ribosomal protein S2
MVHSWPFLKERLQVDRRAKLEKNLGSISDMSRLPAALFVVDIKAEHIAIKKLKIKHSSFCNGWY